MYIEVDIENTDYKVLFCTVEVYDGEYLTKEVIEASVQKKLPILRFLSYSVYEYYRNVEDDEINVDYKVTAMAEKVYRDFLAHKAERERKFNIENKRYKIKVE